MNNILKKKSITLTELLITVAIVAILAGLTVPVYTNAIEKQKDKEAFATLEFIAAAENRYYLHNGEYYPPAPSTSVQGAADINSIFGLRIIDVVNWLYCVEADHSSEKAYPRAMRTGADLRVYKMELEKGVTIREAYRTSDSDWCP